MEKSLQRRGKGPLGKRQNQRKIACGSPIEGRISHVMEQTFDKEEEIDAFLV